MNRNSNRLEIVNNNEKYKEYFEKRGVNNISHYDIKKIRYPNEEQMKKISMDRKVWGIGDRYWILASQYYKSPHYWWIIAWFNRKPIEADLKLGDIIYIPTNLEQVIDFF